MDQDVHAVRESADAVAHSGVATHCDPSAVVVDEVANSRLDGMVVDKRAR